jgi:7-cyano-7-deazaguanine synthase
MSQATQAELAAGLPSLEERRKSQKAIVVMSGGLDSTVLLYDVLSNDSIIDPSKQVHAVSFDYGQRHKKELKYARLTCDLLNIAHTIVDITSITSLLKASVLTDHSREVPEGNYAASNMAATVVPNRNAIMSNIAAGLAVSEGANILALGIHAGDHFVYPDCRPDFVNRLQELLITANEGFIRPDFVIYTPFLYRTKADIVSEGRELNVPFKNTWSCYNGTAIHCGRCGTCVERAEAFALAGVADPTEYESPEYWRTAVNAQ